MVTSFRIKLLGTNMSNNAIRLDEVNKALNKILALSDEELLALPRNKDLEKTFNTLDAMREMCSSLYDTMTIYCRKKKPIDVLQGVPFGLSEEENKAIDDIFNNKVLMDFMMNSYIKEPSYAENN